MMDDPEESPGFGLVCSFWIDTDGYSDRDRQMFTAGFEFADLLSHVQCDPSPLSKTIHRENESRVRMMCSRFGRPCEITPCETEHDPAGTWSYLSIGPARLSDARPD
jgi:hypothetical protein